MGSATQAAVEAAWADIGITPTELRAGFLGIVRLRGWKVRRTISIVRQREAVLTPSAREFVAMLHARWHRRSPRLHRDGSSPRR